MRIVVGGVAGGMSCAARARRLDEDAEIIVGERGPFVSFANCGLPYYVGAEVATGMLPGALHVPHTELRERLDEVREAAAGRPVRVLAPYDTRILPGRRAGIDIPPAEVEEREAS